MGDAPGHAAVARGRGPSARDLRTLYLLVLGVWALLPLIHLGASAEDAVPFVVSGSVDVDDLYPVDGDADSLVLSERYTEAYCEALSDPGDCAVRLTPYVSTPAALPFTVAVGAPGTDLGVLAMRAMAAACLVGGMLLLWDRLAGTSRDAPRHLFVVVAALTPLASITVQLGQTTPGVFLLLCLGVEATQRPARRWATGALLALVTALKVFPGIGLVVVALQRRWRLVVATVVCALGLVALSALIAPLGDTVERFVDTSAAVTGWAVRNPYNASIDAALLPGETALDGAPGPVASVGLVVRAALGVGLWLWARRRCSDDVAVALAMALALVVLPVVWWHYAWVPIAALALAVADGRPDRSTVLVGAALVSAPASVLFLVGRLAWLQSLAWLGIVGAVLVVVASERSTAERASVDGDRAGRHGPGSSRRGASDDD